MRKQRSGRIISISSTAGLVGYEFSSAYCASKFGLDGWMEALQAEVGPFGIQTMIVNPGSFRTELLTKESTTYAPHSIDDYQERRTQQEQARALRSGRQAGDPAKLARALIQNSKAKTNCLGASLPAQTAVAASEKKVAELQQQIDGHRKLSCSLAVDN